MVFTPDFFFCESASAQAFFVSLSQREVTERTDLLRKMVKNVAVNPERVQELVEKGGLKPDTLKRRAKALEDLGDFLTTNHGLSVDEALANPGLEDFLMEFFESLRVEQKDKNGQAQDLSPKGRTMDSVRSKKSVKSKRLKC